MAKIRATPAWHCEVLCEGATTTVKPGDNTINIHKIKLYKDKESGTRGGDRWRNRVRKRGITIDDAKKK